VAARSKAWFGLRPLAWWDYGFKSNHGHGSLFPMSAGCCQVEGCAAGRSGGIIPSVAYLSDLETSNIRRLRPIRVSSHRNINCLCSCGRILYCFISTNSWPQPFTSLHASLIIISLSVTKKPPKVWNSCVAYAVRTASLTRLRHTKSYLCLKVLCMILLAKKPIMTYLLKLGHL